MRSATALHVPAARSTMYGSSEPLPHQIPLPFPGMRPILPVPVERGDAEPLRERAAHFMQALVEVLSGERPSRQMAPWMSPEVYEQLHARLSARARVPSRHAGHARTARLVSVHVAMVSDIAAEIAGRMVHRGRSRAIAVRLELHTNARGRQSWRCTALIWA